MRFKSVIIYLILLVNLANAQVNVVMPEKVGFWDNIVSFDINSSGNYLIVSAKVNNRDLLYESKLEGGIWGELKPLEAINSYKGNTANIGGPFLYFDENTLYFHANYPDGEGGYDIYFSQRKGDGWGEPKSVGKPINSIYDDYRPSVPPGLQRIYLARGNSNLELKKPARAPMCEIFSMATKNPSGQWNTPKPLHDVINKSCQYGLTVMNDAKTVFFSYINPETYKLGYNLYFAQEFMPGSWLLPVVVDSTLIGKTTINPKVAGDYLFFIVQNETRREVTTSIFRKPLPDAYKPAKLNAVKGKVIQLETKKPLFTPLQVFDPITLNVLGEYNTKPETGDYYMQLLDNANYIVDIRNKGLSFASFQVDFRDKIKKTGPELIELFKEIDLDVSVYDREIFRPLEAGVWAETLSDNNKRINATLIEPGLYRLKLPIGHNYKINAGAKGFEDNGFEFNLFGDIIFSQFQRNIPLEPKKKLFEILITDNETNKSVNAEITFKNLNREEVLTIVTGDENVSEIEKEKEQLQGVDDMSDLTKVPFKNPTNPFRFALIIGNEDYKSYQIGLQSESNVDFAMRDASLFKEYATNVLGVPLENVIFLLNARAMDMHNELKRLNGIIKSLDGKAEVYFYFAGHGFPDQQTKEPYIIPVDVSGNSLRFGIKLTDLYTTLTEHPSKKVTVVLDACFSGGARNVGLVSARAVKVRPKENLLKGNLVVFSATSENQTAHPYREKQQGLFTYYFIQKLRETRGNITYKEFSDYIKETVGVRSIIVNYAEQTPQTNVSSSVENEWQQWSFR